MALIKPMSAGRQSKICHTIREWETDRHRERRREREREGVVRGWGAWRRDMATTLSPKIIQSESLFQSMWLAGLRSSNNKGNNNSSRYTYNGSGNNKVVNEHINNLSWLWAPGRRSPNVNGISILKHQQRQRQQQLRMRIQIQIIDIDTDAFSACVCVWTRFLGL